MLEWPQRGESNISKTYVLEVLNPMFCIISDHLSPHERRGFVPVKLSLERNLSLYRVSV